MDPFQLTSPAAWSITAGGAHRLAIMFGLSVASVRVDLRDVARCQAAETDDLLTAIAGRRDLDPSHAASYLRLLRAQVSAQAARVADAAWL